MRYLYIILLFVIASCGGSAEPEVVDINDVLPSSERYAEGDTIVDEKVVIPFSEKLSGQSLLLADTLGFEMEKLDSVPGKWFPDRFQNQSSEKWVGWIGENEAKAGIYKFSDSLAMKNTLFNWFDCFGKKCDPVFLFEERRVMHEAFFVYATEKSLVYLESTGEIDVKQVLKNSKRLLPKEEPLYVLTQNYRQKTVWWKLEKEEWVKFEKEEI